MFCFEYVIGKVFIRYLSENIRLVVGYINLEVNRKWVKYINLSVMGIYVCCLKLWNFWGKE